ncbi:MAG: T9SS C-terminal target domain-containing protein, partial [Bacteroidetes bacterium]
MKKKMIYICGVFKKSIQMKKKALFVSAFSVLLAGIIVYDIQLQHVKASPGGKVGYSGSAGNNGQNCTACHSGTPVNDATITSDIPATGYIPGNVYTLTVTASDPSRNLFGLDLSAEDIPGTSNKGTLSVSTSNLQNWGGEVTQTSPIQGSGNTFTASINWTAPGSGSGDVIFNVAVLAANGNGSSSGDLVHLGSLTVSEATSTHTDKNAVEHINIFPNPVKNVLTLTHISNVNTISIYDTFGKLIYSTSNKGSNTSIINVEKWSSGIYFMQLNTLQG